MDARRQSIFTALQVVAASIFLFILFALKSPWTARRCIGTVLALAGLSMIALARYQLGKSFAIRAEAHHLVTHGLYSKIRNPIYVFGFVTFVGIALIMRLPLLWAAAAVVPMVVIQVIRARREARVLDSAFGETYREYRRRTWF